MAHSANVHSIDAIRDLRAALIKFQHEGKSCLDGLATEVQRIVQWIEYDRPAYWQSQVRRAFDQVAEARSALQTCQMRSVVGRRPSCIEEKQNYKKARLRLEHCETQVRSVKRWAAKIHHELDEFRGRLGGPQRMLEGDIPRVCALLDKQLLALEAYAETPPTPDPDPPTDGVAHNPDQPTE